MKISIITPCYNRSEYLDQTIESVFMQEGDFEIEYIIQNGGTSEEVDAILEKWKKRSGSGSYEIKCRKIRFACYNEPDNGMYDAINKGFSKASGDIFAWINSDDIYLPGSFKTVATVFSHFGSVDWIIGMTTLINAEGSIIYSSYYDPQAYSRQFIREGFYHRNFRPWGLAWVQQESSFWRRSLWETSGGNIDTHYKLAADYHLWKKFASHTDLIKVYSPLAAFRRHGNQKTSEAIQHYISETGMSGQLPSAFRTLKYFISKFPFLKPMIFQRKIGRLMFRWLQLDMSKLIGRVIRWDFGNHRWILFHNPIV